MSCRTVHYGGKRIDFILVTVVFLEKGKKDMGKTSTAQHTREHNNLQKVLRVEAKQAQKVPGSLSKLPSIINETFFVP